MRRAERRGAAGFTLLEVMIVLLIIGLLAGLVLTRGPARGGRVALREASALVSGALRVARSRAIASNQPVPVRFDRAASGVQVGADPQRRLPGGIAIAAAAPVIVFRPDGSSSGGTVELAGTATRATVGVNWLTGHVAVAESN